MRQKHLELVPPNILIKGPFCPVLFTLLMAKDKLKIDLIYMAKGKLKIDLSYECTYKYGHNIVNL